MSRCISAMVLGGNGTPSGVRNLTRRSGALRKVGLNARTPNRIRQAFIRLMMRDRSQTRILALAIGPLRILLLNRRNRRHVAMMRLTAQPADKGALQKLGVQSICLRSAVLTRHGNARRVDHIGFDVSRPKPSGQPEAVAPSLEGHGNSFDSVPSLDRFSLPTTQELEQGMLVGRELLQRVALDARHNPRNQPAVQTHLDYGYQRAVLLEGSA